jgi:hypothetical protein
MRIKFVRRVQYENEGRGKGPVYDKDSVHDFSEAFAQRWLRRGVAVVFADAEPELAAPVKEPEGNKEADELPRLRGFRGK